MMATACFHECPVVAARGSLRLCFLRRRAILWSEALLLTFVTAGCFAPRPVEEEEPLAWGSALSAIERANGEAAAETADGSATRATAAAEGAMEESTTGALERYPIDLPTALRLARAQNYEIALARERINEALARLDQAQVLLLPSLTVGASYHKHEGQIQETSGTIVEASRDSGFVGLGAGAVGAGTVAVPGVSLTADIADVIFEPLIARQNSLAEKARSSAVTNDVLFDISIAYQELVRAKAAVAIAEEAYQNATELARVTEAFAATGEGLESDAERAVVEQLMRDKDLESARESLRIRSARLVELLQLDRELLLDPIEPAVVALLMVPEDQRLDELLSTALSNRPEVEQNQALVEMSSQRLDKATYGPLIPSLAVEFSAGGFGGGEGSSFGHFDDRSDFGAMIYWRLENLGFGYGARAREERSRFQQAQLVEKATLDRIASEVIQAHAQVDSRRRQIGLAATAVEHALRSFTLNRTRISERQGLPIEALQALQSLATTRRLYLDAVLDHNEAQFRLYAALGEPTARNGGPAGEG